MKQPNYVLYTIYTEGGHLSMASIYIHISLRGEWVYNPEGMSSCPDLNIRWNNVWLIVQGMKLQPRVVSFFDAHTVTLHADEGLTIGKKLM